jgi:predicted DsbA family dithiol-disulfide isomerase
VLRNELATVTPLTQHRHRRIATAAERAASSQRVYHRLISRATASRRRDFRNAIDSGVTVEALAAATGLDVHEVRQVLSRRLTTT